MTALEIRGLILLAAVVSLWGWGQWREHVGYEAGKAECQRASDQAQGLRDGQQAILDKIAATDNAHVAENVAALSRQVASLARVPRPQVVKVFPPGCVVGPDVVREVNGAR